MYLLSKLVDSRVGGSTDQHLASGLLGELVDETGAGDCLTRAGGPLDERQRPLQGVLQGELL